VQDLEVDGRGRPTHFESGPLHRILTLRVLAGARADLRGQTFRTRGGFAVAHRTLTPGWRSHDADLSRAGRRWLASTTVPSGPVGRRSAACLGALRSRCRTRPAWRTRLGRSTADLTSLPTARLSFTGTSSWRGHPGLGGRSQSGLHA